MKKYITLAALLAAGTAFANAAEYSFATSGWDTDERNRTTGGNTYYSIDGNVMSLTNSNWSQSLAYFNLSSSEQLVSFSFDIATWDIGSYTISLFGEKSAFTFGKNYDGSKYSYGTTTDTDDLAATALIFKAEDASGRVNAVVENDTGVAVGSTSVTVSGVINGDNELVLTVGSVGAKTIALGDDPFMLKSIGFYGDGTNNTTNVKFSNLSVSTIPEPSAFGLLAGLAALALVGTRRRRK